MTTRLDREFHLAVADVIRQYMPWPATVSRESDEAKKTAKQIAAHCAPVIRKEFNVLRRAVARERTQEVRR